MSAPNVSDEAVNAAAFAGEAEGIVEHFACDDLCARRDMELEAVRVMLAAAAPALRRQWAAGR